MEATAAPVKAAAISAHDQPGGTPITMARYKLRGTPSLILIDRAGHIRLNTFGHLDDLALGATLGRLIDEPAPSPTTTCDPAQGCLVPTKENNQ